MPAIHTILHPTDFSESADFAFQVACALAQAHDARIHVLHVGRYPVITPVAGPGPPGPERYREELIEKLRGIRADDPKVHVEHQLAFVEDPAAEILRVAQRIGPDLIVMGTHGRTGLRRLLMGSVAAQVVRKAACPVVTVKSPLPGTGPCAAAASEAAGSPAAVPKG
jgi:nucleotide-binding universal stress UspA family protein